ncbi:hypothetical protein Bealeia2_01995 (plasmid) [Candidatus Bealeia paramacronuclearis]|uniref:hypothetical protein n=1 Tax=Candidatus Bealeia paramacronuclearis TaxID=1921001 RepID=UPI002CE96147|nr:hypothetical protein [Candidatus Bealeia paramacronuclearis]
MTDESVNYDIQQVQHDIERLQRDLSRLHNDAASPVISSRYEPAVLYDPLHAEENLLERSIISTDNKREIFEDSASVEALIEKEEIRELGHVIAQEIAGSTVNNLNMINPIERKRQLRQAIVSLIAAAHALTEIEVAVSQN